MERRINMDLYLRILDPTFKYYKPISKWIKDKYEWIKVSDP